MGKAILAATLLAISAYCAQSTFDASSNKWTLTNGQIQASFRLTAAGNFVTNSISNLLTGDNWSPPLSQPSSIIHLQAGNDLFDGNRQFLLLDQYTETIAPSGVRQYMVLQDVNGVAQITVNVDIYDNQPVIHYGVGYRNLTASPVYVTSADMLPFTFDDSGLRYTTFVVNQWSVKGVPANFEQNQTVLDQGGTPVEVFSGAHGQQCGWVAIRDTNSRGLFAGWEFDGRTKATVLQQASPGYLQFSASVLNLNHPVAPMDTFQVPSAFLGLFDGNFDDAGYRTQQFMEAALAKPAPDPASFPYVALDTWAFQGSLNEGLLMQNADIAASLGVELYIVDLRWAQAIGNWYEDPAKFPHGLAAISNYVHSLGMKFGLHFALTEADPASP